VAEYVSVSIPESLARRARELARVRRRPLDAVIAEVLDEALPPGGTPEPADDEDTAVIREMEAYTALHSALRKSHPGQHVAILDGQLIDHDRDPEALYRRIAARYPNRFVWLTKVEAEPLATLNFLSPRFVPIP
jgi:hypothetical protein